MGKQFRIRPEYYSVLLPTGQVVEHDHLVTLSDADYATLAPGILRAITTPTDVADPVVVSTGGGGVDAGTLNAAVSTAVAGAVAGKANSSDLAATAATVAANTTAIGNNAATLTTQAASLVAAFASIANKAPIPIPTSVKTAPYTAAVNDFALMNVAGGAVSLTLPTAPADRSQVGFRAMGATTGTPLVVTAGAGDTIGTAGATTASIPLADEASVLQYVSATKQWLGITNIKPQASLDGRFASLVSPAFTGSPTLNGSPLGAGGSTALLITYASGAWPARSTVSSDPTVTVTWVGPVQPPIGGTGTTGMVGSDVFNNTSGAL